MLARACADSQLWELREKHHALIRDWNKFVPTYNAVVAPRPPKRAIWTAPAVVVQQVTAWAGEALISRSGAAGDAGDVFAAFQAETGTDISQAAFGAAMADAGFNKAKRCRRVVYLGVAFRQALSLLGTTWLVLRPL